MVEFHTVVDFHFCDSSSSMALLLKGVHHPLVAGRGASPGVFRLELSSNMCWLVLFVCFSSLFFLLSWLGWIKCIIFAFIVWGRWIE